MSTYHLVRVSRAPIGPPLCAKHFKETDDALKASDVDVEEIEDDACIMCATPPNPKAACLNCGAVLHPQWAAVYCSNACAIADV